MNTPKAPTHSSQKVSNWAQILYHQLLCRFQCCDSHRVYTLCRAHDVDFIQRFGSYLLQPPLPGDFASGASTRGRIATQSFLDLDYISRLIALRFNLMPDVCLCTKYFFHLSPCSKSAQTPNVIINAFSVLTTPHKSRSLQVV